MNKKEFRRKLLQLVMPMTLQYFMFSLVPVADAIMLVRLDQNAMSAVSLAGQVFFVLNLFNYAVTMGVSMLAAQFWGNDDIPSIEQVWGLATRIIVPVGLAFFAAGEIFPRQVMRIFTDGEPIIAYGVEYLRAVSASYIIVCIMEVVQIIMKNTGLVRQVTVISSCSVIINIVLNAVMIYGLFGCPEMGVRGAAVATVISEAVSLIADIIVQSVRGRVRFRPACLLRVRGDVRHDFYKYTTPVFLNQMGWGLGFTTLTVIMGHLGEDAVAANSVVAVVKDMISCFCFALGSGGAIMVGNELGAGRLEEAKECGGRLCRLAIWSGAAAGLIIFCSTPLIISFVNLTEQATFYLKWMLIMCVYYLVGRSINCTVIGGIFCAGGDTRFGFICDTVTMWCVIIPLGSIAAFVLKLPVLAVFFILNLDEMVKLPVVYKHYVKYKWVRNLTVHEDE